MVRCTGYQIKIGNQLQPFKEPDICTRLRLGLPLTDADKLKTALG